MKLFTVGGDSGCGKSSWIWEKYPNAYRKIECNTWDDYKGEEVLVIDDLNEIKVEDRGQWLKWLDRFPIRLNIKYGFGYACWKKIFISSNKHPATIWNEDRFIRRINKLYKFEKDYSFKEVDKNDMRNIVKDESIRDSIARMI